MKHIMSVILSIVFLTLSFASPVSADEITLFNGDRITGEIQMISEGTIHIMTDYAGKISVDLEKVLDLKTEKDGRIALRNGDKITGIIQSISEETIHVASSVLQKVSIPRESFKGLNEPPEKTSTRELEKTREMLQETEGDLKKTQEELFEAERQVERLTDISELWSGSFAVGAQLKRGNTDSSDLRIDSTATRKVPREELRLKFYADYGETDGDTDTNEVFGEAKLKVFQTDRRYLFGLTNMEYDEMENLDLRAQVFGGPGYMFIKNERTSLLGEIGAGLTGEFYDDDNSSDGEENLEASLWLNAEWTQKVFENAEFYQGLTIFPSLGSFGDYRLRSESAIRTPLGEQWASKLSLIDDYDSDPESDDVKKNDLKFVSSIEYKY